MLKKFVSEIVCEDEEINHDLNAILFHSIIVSNLAYKVALELGLSDEKCYELAYAGIMHDIGKIHLNNKLRLIKAEGNTGTSAEEMRYVRNHSKDSYTILKDRDFSEYLLDAVLYHHENYDGTGYPVGLKGTDIPEGARVLRVCDVFAALIDRRVYREPLDIDLAVETMIDEVKNYDMKVFLAFQRVIHEDDMAELFSWIVEHNLEETKKLDEIKKKKKKHYRQRKISKMLK